MGKEPYVWENPLKGSKKFLSEINTGPNNYWYDKPQHMENMRSKITKRFHGRKHTDETKEKCLDLVKVKSIQKKHV